MSASWIVRGAAPDPATGGARRCAPEDEPLEELLPEKLDAPPDELPDDPPDELFVAPPWRPGPFEGSLYPEPLVLAEEQAVRVASAAVNRRNE
jgi:hypothetical protein